MIGKGCYQNCFHLHLFLFVSDIIRIIHKLLSSPKYTLFQEKKQNIFEDIYLRVNFYLLEFTITHYKDTRRCCHLPFTAQLLESLLLPSPDQYGTDGQSTKAISKNLNDHRRLAQNGWRTLSSHNKNSWHTLTMTAIKNIHNVEQTKLILAKWLIRFTIKKDCHDLSPKRIHCVISTAFIEFIIDVHQRHSKWKAIIKFRRWGNKQNFFLFCNVSPFCSLDKTSSRDLTCQGFPISSHIYLANWNASLLSRATTLSAQKTLVHYYPVTLDYWLP